MTLGDKLAIKRKENNLTQEQLAELLGVSRQAVSKWESNTSYPETDKLIRISEIFQCSLDYLLKDSKDGGTPRAEDCLASTGPQNNMEGGKTMFYIFSIIVAFILFYFGGDVIQSIFHVGQELGRAIGNVLFY